MSAEALTEEIFQEFLLDAIGLYADETEGPAPRVQTFAEAGVASKSKGLVVHIGEAEFYVAILLKTR